MKKARCHLGMILLFSLYEEHTDMPLYFVQTGHNNKVTTARLYNRTWYNKQQSQCTILKSSCAVFWLLIKISTSSANSEVQPKCLVFYKTPPNNLKRLLFLMFLAFPWIWPFRTWLPNRSRNLSPLTSSSNPASTQSTMVIHYNMLIQTFPRIFFIFALPNTCNQEVHTKMTLFSKTCKLLLQINYIIYILDFNYH